MGGDVITASSPVPAPRRDRLRRLWLNIHLWTGLVLGLLLVVVGLSGNTLVWHDGLDALLNPHRYQLRGTEPELPPSAYLAGAAWPA